MGTACGTVHIVSVGLMYITSVWMGRGGLYEFLKHLLNHMYPPQYGHIIK